jgi:hypothetical protein
MKAFFNFSNKLILATRSTDWRYSFIPNIFGNIYLWLYLFNIDVNKLSLLLLVGSLFTSFGFAAFGYFINELFDRKDDIKAGKNNKLSELNTFSILFLLLIILCGTFIPWIFLPANNTSYFLIICEISLFLIYSSPPIRLKEHWLLATLIDATYAYVIPFILSAYTYFLFKSQDSSNTYIYFVLLAYIFALFLAGIRNITIHNINDIFYDKFIGKITLPRYIGVYKTNIFLISTIIIEIALCALTFGILAFHHFIFTLGLLVTSWIATKFYKRVKLLKNKLIVHNSNRHATDRLYQFFFPLLFLSVLIYTKPSWWFLLLIHISLFIPISIYTPILSWLVRLRIHLIRLRIDLKQLISSIVNYSIYYAFLICGVNLIKEKKSAWEYIKNKII